jgi:hypothetical protein
MIYIISNERLEVKLLTFRRLKMKPVAESKNLLPQARTRMNTRAQAKTKDLTCVSGWGTVEVGIYRWGPLVPIGGAYQN